MSKFDFGEWSFRFQHDLATDRINCLLIRRETQGETTVLQPNGTFIRVKSGERIQDPSFILEYEHLQAILQGLWDGGLRPKDKRYETEIDLLKDHLADMKRLVFERRIR